MSESNFDFGDMMVVRLAGGDSLLKLKQVSASGEVLDAPGGVVFEAGSAGAGNGKIEASEISIFNVARSPRWRRRTARRGASSSKRAT